MRGSNDINCMDLLLMLLLAGGSKADENEPIVGNTRLQKELFLAQKTLKDYHIERPYSFRPYRYGPYCKEIYNDLDWLEFKGFVFQEKTVSRSKGAIRRFSLTKKGIELIKKMIEENNLQDQFLIIQEIKQKYNSWDVVSLVEYTHEQYPEYIG